MHVEPATAHQGPARHVMEQERQSDTRVTHGSMPAVCPTRTCRSSLLSHPVAFTANRGETPTHKAHKQNRNINTYTHTFTSTHMPFKNSWSSPRSSVRTPSIFNCIPLKNREEKRERDKPRKSRGQERRRRRGGGKEPVLQGGYVS